MRELSPTVFTNRFDEALIQRDTTHTLDIRPITTYEVLEDRIEFTDEWGTTVIGGPNGEPGDEVFLDLIGHPVVRRLHSIAQLTLPMAFETMPGIYTETGSDAFTRWHHAFGSLAFVRKKGLEMGLEPRFLRRLELTTFLSDVTQWVGSHLGDFIFQGFGGPEDAHDMAQERILKRLGLDELLKRHGFTLEEVLLKNLPEGCRWVEDKAPNLCTDRVDYAVKQIRMHLNLTPEVDRATKPDAFIVDPETGELVMRSEELAKAFFKTYLLLGTEHWQAPAHRLNLVLFAEMVKRTLVRERPLIMQPVLSDARYNPQDYMLSVDGDFLQIMARADSFTWILKDIAEHIARHQRVHYKSTRVRELERFLQDDAANKLPDPIIDSAWSPYSLHMPSNVQMIHLEEGASPADVPPDPNAIDIPLPGLKLRVVDPLYLDEDGNKKRLSDNNDNVKALIAHHQALLERTYVARIFVNPEVKQEIEAGLLENNELWEEAMKLPHMSDEEFREAFHHAANFGATYRYAHVNWRV